MTDQIDDIAIDESTDRPDEPHGINRRRMFLAGAGLAGAAALTKAGTAAAADGATYTGSTTTYQNDEVVDTAPGNPGNEALVGEILGTANGSHAIRGNTDGVGHAVAGTVPASNTDNAVAATWGKHDNGLGAGVGGVNGATDVDLAGPARGVEGLVLDTTNGSHAVFGATMGAGHSLAGDTPAEAEDGDGGPNTTAATWGRHGGVGAGIGGVSAAGYGGEFVGGKSHIRLIQVDNEDLGTGEDAVTGPPTDSAHLIGELFADGAGNLYYNQGNGANFTQLNNQGGVVMFVDSQRAFDSREDYDEPANTNKGRFAPGETRPIDLGEFTDIPASASGAIINLTVDRAANAGWAHVFNGATADADRPNGSSINWLPDTYTIANGIIVPVSADNMVKVHASADTEVIIDVVGYVS